MFSWIRIVVALDPLDIVFARPQMNRQLVLANLNSGDKPLNRFSRQRIVRKRFIYVRVGNDRFGDRRPRSLTQARG